MRPKLPFAGKARERLFTRSQARAPPWCRPRSGTCPRTSPRARPRGPWQSCPRGFAAGRADGVAVPLRACQAGPSSSSSGFSFTGVMYPRCSVQTRIRSASGLAVLGSRSHGSQIGEAGKAENGAAPGGLHDLRERLHRWGDRNWRTSSTMDSPEPRLSTTGRAVEASCPVLLTFGDHLTSQGRHAPARGRSLKYQLMVEQSIKMSLQKDRNDPSP